MKSLNKEPKTEVITFRITPSRKKFLKRNNKTLTKFFDDNIDNEIKKLKATKEKKLKSIGVLE